ncbi:MAG: MFS transporter, partial [Candidatus Heimdallarchaeota archaeon]|nr:MFS transporter [Candidatus Heimdallarchaeota archaeon]
MNQASSIRKPINQRNIVLIIISLSSFISAFSGSSIIVAAPTMGAELLMDTPTLSWFVTIFILATALLQIPFGKIADLYGRKKIYFIGMLIFTSATLALGFANSANLL